MTAAEAPAVLVDGTTVSARLDSIDGTKGITLQTSAEKQNISVGQLVEWGAPREAQGPVIVLLSDGGVLSALQVQLADDNLTVTNALAARVTIAIEQVTGILFGPRTAVTDRDRLVVDLHTRDEQSDRVWTRDGDEFSGTLAGISSDSVTIERAGESFDVPMADVETIALDPSLAAVPKADRSGIWCGLADGSRVFASSVTTSGSNVQITRAGISALTLPVAQVVWLLPLRESGALAYVSDLEPARYQHVTLVGPEWPYERDASVTGTPLRAGGRLYDKGLGLHSASRLTYQLGGKYRRFQSLVAIDDQVPKGRGSVVFRVRTDGNVVYESRPLRSGDEPQPVSVDVSGAQRLSLEVDYADRGHVLDRADWLGARLEK